MKISIVVLPFHTNCCESGLNMLHLRASCARQIATEEARVGLDAVRKNRARNKCSVIEDRRG